jgi:hypothetical protein
MWAEIWYKRSETVISATGWWVNRTLIWDSEGKLMLPQEVLVLNRGKPNGGSAKLQPIKPPKTLIKKKHRLCKQSLMCCWTISIVPLHSNTTFPKPAVFEMQCLNDLWQWKQSNSTLVIVRMRHHCRTILVYRFCRCYNIKTFTWFILQPKSVTEIGWWLVH